MDLTDPPLILNTAAASRQTPSQSLIQPSFRFSPPPSQTLSIPPLNPRSLSIVRHNGSRLLLHVRVFEYGPRSSNVLIARVEARDFRDYAKTEVPGNVACRVVAASLQCCSNEPAVLQQRASSAAAACLQCCSNEPAVLQLRACSAAAASLQYCSSEPAVLQQRACSAAATSLQCCSIEPAVLQQRACSAAATSL